MEAAERNVLEVLHAVMKVSRYEARLAKPAAMRVYREFALTRV